LFEAAENSLHLRLYRRYDKHYQTFMAEPSVDGGPDAGSALLAELLVDLNKRLDRGDGYSIDKFDIPKDGDEPAAEMRGGSDSLNTFPGVLEWLRRPFQAAAGIGVGTLVYA
jgi:hypothetical protein